MNYLDNIIQTLQEKYSCNLLRKGDDIDFGLLDISKREEILNFLKSEDFICTFNTKSKMNFVKFYNQKVIDIDIDIELNTDYLNQFFYDIKIKKEYQKEYFKNPKKMNIAINTLRYMLLLRGFDKKYYQFFIENRKIIEKNNYFLDYLNKSPFKKDINFDGFLKVISRNPVYMFKYLKFKYLLNYYKVKLFRKRKFFVAILGIDGSGKSTIINHLKQVGFKSVYLGDRSIKFSNFYKNRYFKPISFLFQYFEKLFLTIKAKLYSYKYSIVTDRYFYWDKKDSLKDKVYSFLYNKLFVKPDITFVLYNSPDIILKRKREVSKEEIEKFNKNIDNLPFKKIVKIKNDDIDTTLNLILKKLYD